MASEPPAHPIDHAQSTETPQAAKRYVLSVIRNDWDWPPPQPTTISGGENATEAENKQEHLLTQREPVGWRTRHEGASDLDLDLSPVSPVAKKRTKRNSDPYKFESPDAIANVIQEQRIKMRRINAEETVWNEGLRTWSERRDAWTSARPQKPRKRSFADAEAHHHRIQSMYAPHKNSTSGDEGKGRDPRSPITNGNVNGTGRRRSTAVDSTDSNEIPEADGLNGPYLPIYPPLFPTSHTLRSRIKPAAYPTIYSKVVLQSLTPNVPIPLTHMIGALVDGWKTEGNWPPQTLAEQQTHALLKRAKGAKKGESAFQKWRREREVERQNENHDDVFEDGFADELMGMENEKRGFRKSISGAVKKVLGIHPQVEEDGGLAKLGLSFGGEEEQEDRLAVESQRVAEDNIALNRNSLYGIS